MVGRKIHSGARLDLSCAVSSKLHNPLSLFSLAQREMMMHHLVGWWANSEKAALLSTVLGHGKCVVNTGSPVEIEASGWSRVAIDKRAAAPTSSSVLCRALARGSTRAPDVLCVHTEANTSPSNRHFPTRCPSLAPAGPRDQVCCSLCLHNHSNHSKACFLKAAGLHEQTVPREDNGEKQIEGNKGH